MPQLSGTAAVCDLFDLVPRVNDQISDAFVVDPASVGTEYLLFGGRQLMLYFDYLPSWLSQNESLDNAITCLVAALRDLCSPRRLSRSGQNAGQLWTSFAGMTRQLG